MSECCSSCTGSAKSPEDLLWALRLEQWTLLWMVVESVASLAAGMAANSLLLAAFGADSVIELLSACLLYYRLREEWRGRLESGGNLDALERRTAKMAGYLLYALSLFVVIEAAWGLMHRHEAETSIPGLVIAVIAAFGMPVLAKAKLRAADLIGSPALRADAMETFTCGYLSWVLLAGLAANALLHWWWIDSAASLIIVPLLLKEAKEAVTGQCGCH